MSPKWNARLYSECPHSERSEIALMHINELHFHIIVTWTFPPQQKETHSISFVLSRKWCTDATLTRWATKWKFRISVLELLDNSPSCHCLLTQYMRPCQHYSGIRQRSSSQDWTGGRCLVLWAAGRASSTISALNNFSFWCSHLFRFCCLFITMHQLVSKSLKNTNT